MPSLFLALKSKLEKLLKSLLMRFVRPSAMIYKNVLEVDFKTPSSIKQSTELIIGHQAGTFLTNPEKNHLRSERIEEFYTSVVKFFKVSCSYIKSKLPLKDPLLDRIQVVDPAKQLEARFSDLEYFLKKFPKIVGPEVTASQVQLEFASTNALIFASVWSKLIELMPHGGQ